MHYVAIGLSVLFFWIFAPARHAAGALIDGIARTYFGVVGFGRAISGAVPGLIVGLPAGAALGT